MSNRDEFSEDTKRKVALRANHHCSFRGCPQPTSGPSDKSPEAVTMIGKAAHIHSAAAGSGARRHLPSMSREERIHITNAIWLCATHADLIDRDEVTFTAEMLRVMKAEHEARCAQKQRNPTAADEAPADLIAIGPDLVFVGEFLGVENDVWSIHLRSFVDGDIHSLTMLVDGYNQIAAIDRYVLVNALGDGRALSGRPSVIREPAGGYTIRCPISPSADRISATQLPKSWALSDDHDLVARDGNWAMVSGLDALPQQVKTCLSHQRGESPFHGDAGTRLAEYYKSLAGSPWLDRYLKLELIRQAAIPYLHPTGAQQYTPLMCVQRVFGIEILADAPTGKWLPISVDLDVKGVGRWQHSLSVCIPVEPIRRTSFKDLLAGPAQPPNSA